MRAQWKYLRRLHAVVARLDHVLTREQRARGDLDRCAIEEGPMGVAELEIARVDWTSFVTVAGPATGVGVALRALLGAADADQASEAYWRLENHVVVQGELYDAAEPCTSVLVAAFADPRPSHVRIAVLELLFQVVTGGPPELAQRCKAKAREGLWLLVREAVSGEREAALDVLRALDADGWTGAVERLQALKIYWEGEEHVGLLLYGLRPRGEQPHFELDDRLPDGARRSGPWVIRGESWEVDHWTIRVGKLPVGAQWRAWLERVLDDLLQAGYEVAWFALEGDFADPPELFGPARSTSVYAAASRDTGFVCHDAGEGSMRFLTREDIARLRRSAAAVWADGGVT